MLAGREERRHRGLIIKGCAPRASRVAQSGVRLLVSAQVGILGWRARAPCQALCSMWVLLGILPPTPSALLACGLSLK